MWPVIVAGVSNHVDSEHFKLNAATACGDVPDEIKLHLKPAELFLVVKTQAARLSRSTGTVFVLVSDIQTQPFPLSISFTVYLLLRAHSSFFLLSLLIFSSVNSIYSSHRLYM